MEVDNPEVTVSAAVHNANISDGKKPRFGNRYNKPKPSVDDTTAQVSKTPKRQRSAQSTPENKPKRQRTFVNVVSDDLIFFIVDKLNGISVAQAGLLKNSLMAELDNFLDTEPKTAPTFHLGAIRYGKLKVICAFSAQWLNETVLIMAPQWKDANLMIEVFKPPKDETLRPRQQPFKAPGRQKTPWRPSIRFYVPNGMTKPSYETVAKRLLQS